MGPALRIPLRRIDGGVEAGMPRWRRTERLRSIMPGKVNPTQAEALTMVATRNRQ